MKKLYKAGRRYFDSACQGDPVSLRLLFQHRARLWGDPEYEREVIPSQLFADFSCEIESHRAFALVPLAAELVLEQDTASEVECGLWLIWQLARSSSTTELPQSLQRKLPLIRCCSTQYGDATIAACAEIMRHYRLQPRRFEFTDPWHPCTDSSLDAELRRETPQGHVLFGVVTKLVARRQDMDEFLFELTDGRFANVHLTWAIETNPAWPSTRVYGSRAAMEFEIQRQIDEWNEIESDYGE